MLFWRIIGQPTTNKNKIDNIIISNHKSLQLPRETVMGEESTYVVRENIYKLLSDNRLVSGIYNELKEIEQQLEA